MALREDMEKQGLWLFRWRSFLPLLCIPLLFLALKQPKVLEEVYGSFISNLWTIFCICLSFSGLLIRCFTVGYVPRGTSGRNTKSQVAEVLNTTGMYSIVRNPLYLANFVTIFGVTLFTQVWWLALLTWIGFLLYYERIIFAEEEFLRAKFQGKFLEWADKTPMLIPRFSSWEKPALPFSLKTVLRREFSTFFSIVAAYFFIELIHNFLLTRKFYITTPWIVFFLTGFVIYWSFFFLKKKTTLLNVSGR